MANILTNVMPKLLAQGLLALRQQTVMPLLVNRQYDPMAGMKGSTIDVPIPSAIAVQDVLPANIPPSTGDVAPTSVPIVMSQWKEAPFYLSDKDMLEAMDGMIPMQASEAIKSIANTIDSYIFGLYPQVYGTAGTAGTTPFSDGTTKNATDIRTTLNKQLAPMDDRRLVCNPDAEGSALNLTAFQSLQFSGSAMGLLQGDIGTKFGFSWFMDQNVPYHTAGTASSATVTQVANVAVGATTVTLKVATGTATLKDGDIITFAGDTQTYAVNAAAGDITLDTTGVAVPLYNPSGVLVAQAGATTPVATTVKASHVVNLGFHRDAFAFASRPLENVQQGLGSLMQHAVDPISKLSLRLEITREYKRTRFAYDVLYGANCIRPQLAGRLLG